MTKGKSLCLNMIVRNEMANLERCLGSIADHISCWIIGDTESTDGTKEFIKSFFAERGIPGELHSFPFLNFEQARNAALERAEATSLAYDYLLLADADMELVVEDRDFLAKLDAPGYRLIQRTSSGLTYWNTRLVRRDIGARYHGVTHEYIDVPGGVSELHGVWYKDHASGSNRIDKFERDIRLLTEALEQDPESHRYWFYLAQSYRDAGQREKAAEIYAKRAAMGGWDEEAWYARLQQARCLRDIKDEGGFIREALAAFNERPHRAEPLYDLARFYRERGMNAASVLFSEFGLTLPRPDRDVLFIEDHVYEAGMHEEYSIAANYASDPARKDRGHDACNWLALNRKIPDGPRNLARSNLLYYLEPAASLMPSFAARQVSFTPPDGYLPMNPSIARWGDRIVMVQRTVNYVMTGDNQYETPSGAPITTRNFLLRLDPELNVESSTEILPPDDMPEPLYTLVKGFEDMRPFAWRGELWCISNVRELTSEGWCEQVLARINRAPNDCRLRDWRALHPEGPREHEKNWMPLVDGDQLQFIYLCDPTRIVDEQARKIIETVPPIAAEQFRGGSQAIPFDDGWLALIHEAREQMGSGRRHYRHRFVWFDSARVLRGVSRAFFFSKKAIEYAAGLAWHPENRLLLSFSVEDRESWLATVDAEDVRSVLQDVERLSSARPLPERQAEKPISRHSLQPEGRIVCSTVKGQKVRFLVANPRDAIMKYHSEGVFYETEELGIIGRHYTGKGTFLDIGANVGNHAVYLSLFFESPKVIVFEPNPVAIAILRENLRLNDCRNVETRFLGTALAGQSRWLKATTPDSDNLGHTVYYEDEFGEVQAVAGDSLLSGESVEFIKVDVEGMEFEILSGLAKTIERCRPTIFIEVWDNALSAFSDWCRREQYQVVEQFQRYPGIQNFLVKPSPVSSSIEHISSSNEIKSPESAEVRFSALAPFLSAADSPADRRRLSWDFDRRVAPHLKIGTTASLPQIHCFYEVLSDTAQHHGLIAATASMRAAGHPVRVWTYSPNNLGFLLEQGVELRSAEDVMPRALFERIVAGSEIRYFSDIFRYAVLYEHGGLWMDTDVVLLRPFPYCGDYFLNLQWRGAHRGHFICGNVMFATSRSRHLRALYEASIDRFFESGGKEFGDIGPKLLSDYVMSDAGAELRKWVFSPMLFNTIDWTEVDEFNQPINELADYLNDERVFGVHLWNAKTNARTREEGSSLISILSNPIGGLRSLTTLAERFNTDKNRHTGNRHFYSRIYDQLLSSRRFSLRRLMEIGLCRGLAERHQTEMPSVELWQAYFPYCHVTGIDLTDFSRFNSERFSSLVCDQSRPDELRAVAGRLEPASMDIIIDDGSHASFDQQATLREFFPLLADGGWYFIEDLDWQPPGEDRKKVTLTKQLLREIQQYGASRSIDPLGICKLSDQISQILFFDSHYELNRAKLLGGLVAIQKRRGSGLV